MRLRAPHHAPMIVVANAVQVVVVVAAQATALLTAVATIATIARLQPPLLKHLLHLQPINSSLSFR